MPSKFPSYQFGSHQTLIKNQLFTELVRIVHDKIQPRLRLCMAARIHRSLERLAEKATKYAGSSWAFAGAVAVVAAWLLTGPLFKFSDTWQLVINTGTTIVTFLMVFLIQRTQNKETQAIQLKLNELVAALKGASNRLIDLEDWTEEELWNLHQHYRRLAELARESQDTHRSLSVDSAEARHKSKHSGTDKSAA